MAATAAKKLRDKLAKLFAMLGSSVADERKFARRKIDDLLTKNKKNWNDLVELLSTGNAQGWHDESDDTGGGGSVDESSLTGPAKASRRKAGYRGAQRTRARGVLRRIYPGGTYPTEEEVSTPDLWDRFCAAAVQRKKDAGAPRPWTNDPILDEGKFCHIERERDRTTVHIRENWRQPHADNPDLWFAMSLARRVNHWPALAEIAFPVPWNAEQFLARMRARAAHDESCFNSSAYRLLPGCPQGMSLIEFLGQQMLPMLWSMRDHLRPRSGETLRAFCERLQQVHGWGPFLAAQVVADLKYVEPLKSAADWATFAVSGPGSSRGVNRICGRPVDARWVESDWYRKLCELRAVIAPELERLRLGNLHMQDVQNICCEYDKFERWRIEGIPPAKRYRPASAKPARQIRSHSIVHPTPQITGAPPVSDWRRPAELPDLRRADIVALDLETKDGRLLSDRGSGWPFGDGYICGVSIAYHEGAALRTRYFPLRHPDSQNFDPTQLFQWLRDLITSDVRIVTQNGLYDWGWLRAEAGILMPAPERLEEIGALATLIDENRFTYGLDALCAWRGLPGKHETLLKEAAASHGLPKKVNVRAHLWQLPARYVGPYAEADAANTLALWESLYPVLDQEGTSDAYRLEVDLLPMVLEMRRRGVRIDAVAAESARDQLLQKRDAALADLSGKLGVRVDMAEIGRTRWLAETFDKHGIGYPRTEKGAPSFTAGSAGWMHKHPHWLPQLIVRADKTHNAAVKFLENYILGHMVNGRIHAEIHPHRSDAGGTRSLRFSYSDPPLQQMTAHDEELAPLIRGVFLPEEGEVWAKPDVSQQEFRFIVHYAIKHCLRKAKEAADRYRADPDTDFHQLVADWTGIDRQSAKVANFAKAFGAGVRRFAAMIDKPEAEARTLYTKYDRELPFVSQLSALCQKTATKQGYIELYDGARRHWDNWEAPAVAWTKGMGPCSREEAERRVRDPNHAWHRRLIRRAETHKAMNALIQGSAARHTKLWMRACWREGILPLLQMHDALDCSVASQELAERVAQLGRDAVTLEVPMQIDLKFGRTWGDAKHTWEALTGTAPAPKQEPVVAAKPQPTTPQINGTKVHVAVAQAPIELPQKPEAVAEEMKTPLLVDLVDWPLVSGKICCPFHDDSTPSCHIYPDHFYCFGCGAHGDAIDWLMMVEGLDRDAAIKLLANWQAPSSHPRRNEDNAHTFTNAMRLWEQAQPIAGTPAIQYLADVRRIDTGALPAGIETALRFHPRCPFGPGTRHPCLLALMRDGVADAPTGIQRMALTPEVLAGGEVERRMLGRAGAVKLWPAASSLVIGEGIETVLAAATRIPYRGAPLQPAWSTLTSGKLSTFPVLPGVERLIILVDHDINGAGQLAATVCMERWSRAGRTVVRLTPERVGADFNDLVMPE